MKGYTLVILGGGELQETPIFVTKRDAIGFITEDFSSDDKRGYELHQVETDYPGVGF